jgi:hypothetical protein
MKTGTRSILITLLSTTLFTAGAWAAPGQGNGQDFDSRNGPPTAEDRLARMSEALDLSADQALAMLEVLLAAEQRQAQIREQNRALIEPQVCADRLATEADVLAILDDDQALLFQEMKAQRESRANQRKSRHGPSFDCSAYSAGN